MTDDEFARRYMIVSLTGRIWTRSMVRRAALERVRTSPLPGVRDLPPRERATLVDRVLDDDGFMRRRAGEIPARVIDAIEDRCKEINMRLSDVATIAVNQPDADFWLIRRGSEREVGRPVDEYDPERIGVLVTRTDILLPRYLFYVFANLHARGYWIPRARGTTRLVNIRTEDVKRLELSAG